MSVSPELLYTSHQTQWESFLSTDASIETLLSAKCDQLLLSEEECSYPLSPKTYFSFPINPLYHYKQTTIDKRQMIKRKRGWSGN